MTVAPGLHTSLVPAYRRLRRRLVQLDRAIDRRAISTAEFVELLERLGVTSGATVLVFSSMENLGRRVPGMRPLTLIRLLQERLGADGTLLMPTFSFRGRQRDYADRCHTFDVRKTPSQCGLVPEVFRRMPGVIRSLHPTHSIAGWGRHAADLLCTHHLGTGFGRNSPMYKLQDYGGRVVGLGTRAEETFTILHVPEELHSEARAYAYEDERRMMTIVVGAQKIPYAVDVLRAAAGRDRLEHGLLKTLLREGVIKSLSERGLRCCVARADQVIQRALELIDGFGGRRLRLRLRAPQPGR